MRSPIEYESPNCAGTDTEAFFPGATHTLENQAAKRICGDCLHLDECLEWGLHHERYGIWGGTTAFDRDKLRRQRKILIKVPHLELLPPSVRAS